MKEPAPQRYVYVPPARAMSGEPRYFHGRDYTRKPYDTLKRAEGILTQYAPKEKREGQMKLPMIPTTYTAAERAKAKADIYKMLDHLITAAPVDEGHRTPLRESLRDLRDAPDRDMAAMELSALQRKIKQLGRECVPDAIKGSPKTIAGLRDKNIHPHLQHMWEVLDACAQEARLGQRFHDRDMLVELRGLENRTHMVLSMARLDEEVTAALKSFDRDKDDLLVQDSTPHLIEAVGRSLDRFEPYMDAAHGSGWRENKLRVPEDWARKGKGNKMPLGEMIEGLRKATTEQELKPYAELLHYVVAKRAFHFKRDLAKAYVEDHAQAEKIIFKRNKKRYEQPEGENPFRGHQEIIDAAYSARWAVDAGDALRLMKRFQHTLDDPGIVPPEQELPTAKIDKPEKQGCIKAEKKGRSIAGDAAQ